MNTSKKLYKSKKKRIIIHAHKILNTELPIFVLSSINFLQNTNIPIVTPVKEVSLTVGAYQKFSSKIPNAAELMTKSGHEKLLDIGEHLTKTLLSHFWPSLNDSIDMADEIILLSNDFTIPWELAIYKDEPLAISKIITRIHAFDDAFIPSPPRPNQARNQVFAATHQSFGELDWLRKITWIGIPTVLDNKVSAEKVVEAVDQKDHSLIYLRCHAYQGPTPDSSRLMFQDNARGWLPVSNINALQLTGLPLVIVNACAAGAAHPTSFEKLGTFSKAFLNANASAYLGALWDSPIKKSESFVEEVLKESTKGISIGEAVKNSRKALFGADGRWAMFVLYGQPDYHIWNKAAAQNKK